MTHLAAMPKQVASLARHRGVAALPTKFPPEVCKAVGAAYVYRHHSPGQHQDGRGSALAEFLEGAVSLMSLARRSPRL